MHAKIHIYTTTRKQAPVCTAWITASSRRDHHDHVDHMFYRSHVFEFDVKTSKGKEDFLAWHKGFPGRSCWSCVILCASSYFPVFPWVLTSPGSLTVQMRQKSYSLLSSENIVSCIKLRDLSKLSSPDLSWNLNEMYRWPQGGKKCYGISQIS